MLLRYQIIILPNEKSLRTSKQINNTNVRVPMLCVNPQPNFGALYVVAADDLTSQSNDATI